MSEIVIQDMCRAGRVGWRIDGKKVRSNHLRSAVIKSGADTVVILRFYERGGKRGVTRQEIPAAQWLARTAPAQEEA